MEINFPVGVSRMKARLVRRYQAFEFLKPVEDDVDLGGRSFHVTCSDHDEALAIRSHIIIRYLPIVVERSLKKKSWPFRIESWLHLKRNDHHLISFSIEQLRPISCPNGLPTSSY